MAYDREGSKHTTLHLEDPREMDLVREAARNFRHEGWYENLRALPLVEFLYLTGAHPIVLAQPVRFNLRSKVEGSYLHVLWERPKKSGIAASMDLPVAREASETANWIPAFISAVVARPYSTVVSNRLLREVGVAAGVPLSARRLRHTCGVRIARKSRDIATVCAWLNCSKSVAADYLRIGSATDPRMLELAE